MQSNIITKYIIQLFQEEDKVIIPGLGIIEAELQPLLVNPGNGLAEPDRKSLVGLTQEPFTHDNTLIKTIAEQEKISELEAKDMVNDWVTSLKVNDETIVPGLGVFRVSDIGALSFIQADDNILLTHFGLPTLHNAVPLVQERPAPPAAVKPQPKPTRNNGWVAVLLKYREIQLALLLVIILGALTIFLQRSNTNKPLATNPNTENLETPTTDTDNPLLTDDYLEAQEEPTEDEINPSTPTATTDNTNNTTTTSTSPATSTTTSTTSSTDVTKDNYLVVVGTFGKLDNANDMVKDVIANGYMANMQEVSNGMYRISILVNKKDNLKSELSKIRNDYPKAWVKK